MKYNTAILLHEFCGCHRLGQVFTNHNQPDHNFLTFSPAVADVDSMTVRPPAVCRNAIISIFFYKSSSCSCFL